MDFEAPPPRIKRDVSTRIGAEELAAEIEELWHQRGYPQVRAWVEAKPVFSQFGAVYTVRTNLIGGLPPPAER
jgi:hypothetical protein